MKKTALTLLTASIGGIVAVGAYKVIEPKEAVYATEESRFPVMKASSIISSTGQLDFTAAASMVTPAVVHIKTTYSAQSSTRGGSQIDPFGDMFEDFFNGRGRGRQMNRQPQKASGSGVIISKDGYIITNNHVVDDADEIEVVLNDKRTYKAKLVGADPNTDLAVVKIDEKDLPFVKYGNSDNVRVGEWVLAVGNPFNLTSTVTAGIISAKARNIGILQNQNDPNSRPIEAFIQTDAAINPGNSGGALVNTNGELIGINAAIASQTGSYEGYGFAIPVNLAKKTIEDIMQYGTVQRGYIGVSFQENSADLAKQNNLKTINGIYVADVSEGGAAGAAGIKKGDVITKIEGAEVSTGSDLQENIGRHRPGDAIKLTVLRGSIEKEITVVLKNIDNKAELVKAALPSASFDALGAKFSPLKDSDKKKYRLETGAQITSMKSNSILAQSQISQGFIVTRVNGRAVGNEDDVRSALKYGKNGLINIEGIYPDEPSARYSFSFPDKADTSN